MKKRKILLSILMFAVAGLVFGGLLYQGRIPLRSLACDGEIERLRFSPDGHYLAAIIRGKNISVWDTRKWKRFQTFPGVFDTCYFLPDSQTLVTSCSYSIGTGPLAEAVNHGQGLTMAEWKQVNNTMQFRLQCWDVITGRATKTFVLAQSNVQAAAPKANRVVLLRLISPTGMSFVDTTNGHEIHFLPDAATVTAGLSPDGRWIALVDFTKHQGRATIWNTQTWQPKPLQSSPGPNSVDFSPDGKLLEASSAQNITVWRVSDWQRIAVFPTNYDDAGRSQFTLDSRQIVADGSWKKIQPGSPNTAVTIWDVATKRKVATEKHQELIFWRLTSRGLVTADTYHFSSHLWNTKNGQQLWQGCAGYGSETAVSTDKHTLVTAHLTTHNPNEGSVIEVRHLP